MRYRKEKVVVKEILQLLRKEYPGFYFKTHGGPFQKIGLPDIIGVYKGLFIAIEVKSPGKENTLTKIQRNTLQMIHSCGGIAFMSTGKIDTQLKMRQKLKLYKLIIDKKRSISYDGK